MARRTDSAPGTKIYVGNLPWGMDESEVEQQFMQFGTVVDKIIIKDRETGRSKGFGFITFADAEAATAAMNAMNGQDIGGRAVRVNLANDKAGSGAGFGSGGGGYSAGAGGYGGGGGQYGGSGYGGGSYGAPQSGYGGGAPAYGGGPASYGGGAYAGQQGGYPQSGGYGGGGYGAQQGGYPQSGYQQPPPGSF